MMEHTRLLKEINDGLIGIWASMCWFFAACDRAKEAYEENSGWSWGSR